MPRKPSHSKGPTLNNSVATKIEAKPGEEKPSRKSRVAKATDSPAISKQWKSLRKAILAKKARDLPDAVFGASVSKGNVYRWGFSTAHGRPCDDRLIILSELAAGQPPTPKRFAKIDLLEAVHCFQDELSSSVETLTHASEATLWAAALPDLLPFLGESQWWDLLGVLQDYRDTISHQASTRPQALVAVAELGLTLSWRLRELPSCKRLRSSSLNALQDWIQRDDESVSMAIARPLEVRLALASLIRCKRILRNTDDAASTSSRKKSASKANASKWLQSFDKVAAELMTWAVAMTRPNGTQLLSQVTARDVKIDLGESGLLMQAARFDKDALVPALSAALAQPADRGKLSWQVNLPDSMLHDEEASVACLMPEWDVRRGRIAVQYSRPEIELEMLAGKASVICGPLQTHIAVDGKTLTPEDQWVASCEYTDDDIHYLELELPYSEGYVLQRQLMVIREDRCCLIADAVLKGHHQLIAAQKPAKIDYQLRLPLGPSIQCEFEGETTEAFLSDQRRRALVMPLSAAEWKDEPSSTKLSQSDDGHLVVKATGMGQLYTPLWFDFYRSRFRAKRTWRALTVAQNLQPTPSRDAAAFRVQMGSEQWILYRSLIDRAPRTFMGKHMITDFYCARFDARKQSYEDLISVDDNDDGEKKPSGH